MEQIKDRIKSVANEAKDLIEKILKWRAMKLNPPPHIKYEPHKTGHSKHLDAIMADVNEDPRSVESALKMYALADEISVKEIGLTNILGNLNIAESELSTEEKAKIEHEKMLKKQREMQIYSKLTKDIVKKPTPR